MADEPEDTDDPGPSGPEDIDRALDEREEIEAPSDEAGRVSFVGSAGSAVGKGSGSLDGELAKRLRNDMGNGERLIARHGEDLKYVKDVGWYAWRGPHWCGDTGPMEARRRAHKTARAIFDEAATLDDEGRIKAHQKHAGASGGSGMLTNMLKEAEPYIDRGIEDLDANPYLFNVQNGTLVLEGSCETIRPPQRDDLITRISPVQFDAAARAPQFEKFLARILPEPTIRVFVQTWFGYALTGITSEQVLAFFYGRGANGKSTLLNVTSRVMGNYVALLPFQSLLHNEFKGGGDASPDLARLPGARLVTATEPEQGSRFSESVLKSLTGGDRMIARHLRQDFFEFKPIFKLTLSGNNQPTIRGQDEGIWRRLLLVPFEETIPEEERVGDFDDHLYGAEAPGILNWLLDGCRLWLDKGLAVPEGVRAATATYRSESDSLGEFLSACVTPLEKSMVPAKTLYETYTAWCEANGADTMKQGWFGRRLRERGYKKDKAGVYVYVDIELIWRPASWSREEVPL